MNVPVYPNGQRRPFAVRRLRSNVMAAFCRCIAIAILLCGVRIEAAFGVGPSFDCDQSRTPMTNLICSDARLSRIDLEFLQTYHALRQQVGAAGFPALRQEDVDFIRSVAQRCGIPAADFPPADRAAASACLGRLYQEQRSVWLGRLVGLAQEEANRPIESHVELQRQLRVLGFLSGSEKIDGVY